MNYPVQLTGFEGQTVEIQPAGVFSTAKLLVNGQPAPRGPQPNSMLLRRNDGREIIATWKQQFMGLDVPQLVVDGVTVKVVEPLKWYEWAWSGIPVLLVFVGGALGGMCGVIGLVINTQIFRSSQDGVLKFAAAGAVSVASILIYLILAMLFMAATGR